MKIYKECDNEPYSFLVNDTTFSSDHPLRSRNNLMELISKAIMTIDELLRYEKVQYDINREAAKISALFSANMDTLQVKKYYLQNKVE